MSQVKSTYLPIRSLHGFAGKGAAGKWVRCDIQRIIRIIPDTYFGKERHFKILERAGTGQQSVQKAMRGNLPSVYVHNIYTNLSVRVIR